jgi:hypothetical protein
MADHEQQPGDYSAQQDENAVALTTVGEPEPPVTVHTEPIERDHEAVDVEQGNFEQAATFTGDEQQATSTTVKEEQTADATVKDEELPNTEATTNDEPVTTATLDVEQSATENLNDIPADIEMDNAQLVPEEPISELPKLEDLIAEQQVLDAAESDAVMSATEEQIAEQEGNVAEDTTEESKDVPLTGPANDADNVEAVAQEEPVAEAEEANDDNAGEDSADDLFGSDDEAPKTREQLADTILSFH